MYLEHAMASTTELDADVIAEFANYERKEDLALKLQGYVTGEAFEEKLKAYVPVAEIILGSRKYCL